MNASTFRTTTKKNGGCRSREVISVIYHCSSDRKKAVNRRLLSKFIIASINSPSFNSSIFSAVAGTFLCRRRTPYPRTPMGTQSGRKKRRDESCHRCHELPDWLPLARARFVQILSPKPQPPPPPQTLFKPEVLRLTSSTSKVGKNSCLTQCLWESVAWHQAQHVRC